MKKPIHILLIVLAMVSCKQATKNEADRKIKERFTSVAIRDSMFLINGKPSLEGKEWRGYRVEGLLPNSRMVQGIFDDTNAETTEMWAYPDTKQWDADRNTREFIAAMEQWKAHGLLAFTINFQGGSP